MARKNLYDTLQNNKEEPVESAFPPPKKDVVKKEYMYKPFGVMDNKKVYAKINFVESIFRENIKNGWVDTIPEDSIIK